MATASPALRLKRRFAAWAAHRQGIDPIPVTLDRRRVYILPTRQGLLYALAVFVMLLASLNYNNNLGLLLTFLLAGVAIAAMHRCQRNLVGITIHLYPPAPVFAGETLYFPVLLRHAGRQRRFAVSGAADVVDIPPGQSVTAHLAQPARRRGRQPLARFSLATTFPLGLFRAWTWIDADISGIAYPVPAARPAPSGANAGDSETATGSGSRDGDDFAGLRAWREGDSIKHIDWHALARGRGLLTKQFGAAPPVLRHYDLAALAAVPLETALSRIARSVLDADAEGAGYSLKLGDRVLGPASGAAHRERCLVELAIYGE